MSCDWANMFPSTDDVVLVGFVLVGLLLVDEMLTFIFDWGVPVLLPFL